MQKKIAKAKNNFEIKPKNLNDEKIPNKV